MNKTLICTCMDVTTADLQQAVKEGYGHPELAKRYTGAMMGFCQGKCCAVQFLQVLARLTDQPLETLRVPTLRPPIIPVPLRGFLPPDSR